jgi:hypothetical protein
MEAPSARPRNGARAAVLSAVLVACAYGIVDALPEASDEPPVAEPEEASRAVVWQDAEPAIGATPCDTPTKVVTFLLDGAPTEMEIFVACDPTPYRELGDPPPPPLAR